MVSNVHGILLFTYLNQDLSNAEILANTLNIVCHYFDSTEKKAIADEIIERINGKDYLEKNEFEFMSDKTKRLLKGKKHVLTGFLDTGNKLYDNYKHRPVIIIDKKINYELDEVIYVPYMSLNNKSILKCLKTDKIIINNHVFKNYLVGLSNKKINIDGINCILHSKMKGMI